MTLSVCAIALNEEALIGGMLSSVAGLADEVVLGVDSRTSDATTRVALEAGARVFGFDWCDNFSYARNLTIDAASGDWILVLDADERLLPAGAAVIREVLDCAPAVPAADSVTGLAFMISQRDLDETVRVIQRSSGRLFRRRPEIRYTGIVHEEPTWLPEPAAATWVLVTGGEAHIAHYGYDPTLWHARHKYERNLHLLEERVARNPSDDYARDKLRALRLLEGVRS